MRARPRNVFRVSLPSGRHLPPHRRALPQVGAEGLVCWIIPPPTPAERKLEMRALRERLRFQLLKFEGCPPPPKAVRPSTLH